jgi:serine/threonine protein kinase/tetratricopeptide (TPR) repeat protein
VIGTSVAHYTVIEKIGEGGMGVVYRARDTRLGREVALKFLPEGVESQRPALERFRREAQAASSLSHPNICTVHDLGEHGGRPYLVLEYVEGASLRGRIPAGGLEAKQVAAIGVQIAEGLEAAHRKGIIHRDIKPENVFVTPEGGVKILDFGLAKLWETDRSLVTSGDLTELQLTRAGAVVGSVAYMSPEQARGREIDPRTDIFSLGAVLYEMATGKRAFPGTSAAEVFDAILNREPGGDHTQALPPGLGRVIARALAKDPGLRYQSAAELAAALEGIRRDPAELEPTDAVAAPSSTSRTVAVLPFRMLFGETEYSFLSLALAEAVSHDLSLEGGLELRSAGAIARYAEREIDPMQVARELRVSIIVAGSIQKLGPTVRVQVQAWEAPAGSTLLSVKLDGTLDDLFGLQDRVAEALSRGLGVRATMGFSPLPTASTEAYELYLRATERLMRWNHADTAKAIEMLRSAVSLDAAFGQGWSRLSSALVSMGALFDTDPKWIHEAKDAIRKALDLDPASPEAHSARGRMLWSPTLGFRNAEALRDLGTACNHPTRPWDAVMWRGTILSHVGLHQAALDDLDAVLHDDPDNPIANLTRGETLTWCGEHEQGLEFIRKSVRLDPSLPYGHLFLPIGLITVGDLNGAEQALQSSRGILGDDSMLLASEAILWARRGEAARARDVLEGVSRKRESVSHAHHTRHCTAAARALLGDTEGAVRELEEAARTGLPDYPAFRNDPHLAVVRHEPAFTRLMEGLEKGWRSLEAEFGDAHAAFP